MVKNIFLALPRVLEPVFQDNIYDKENLMRLHLSINTVAVLLVLVFSSNSYATTLSHEQALVGATKIYNDMVAIDKAVEQYRIKYSRMPYTLGELLNNGILNSLPVLGDQLGGGNYEIGLSADDMDGRGEYDHVIALTSMVPMEVCVEFNKLYAAEPLNNGTVFDRQAANEKYPGQVYGRQMKTFALKWETAQKDCEINWVLDYR